MKLRYDDLCREERFFSATILPYLLSYNNFSGFKPVEYLLSSMNLLEICDKVPDDIQLVTEIYLERDLSYYKIQIPSESFERKGRTQRKPDIMIIWNNTLILCECKFFTNDSEYKLLEQLKEQAYVIDIIKNTYGIKFSNVIHLLIIPYDYVVRGFPVLTWSALYDCFKTVIPEDDYFMKRLKSGISRTII